MGHEPGRGARIAPEWSRLTDLAEQAQITKQSAGFLIDQLERAGYVHRTPDPTDARARLVSIAPRGAEAIPIAAAARPSGATTSAPGARRNSATASRSWARSPTPTCDPPQLGAHPRRELVQAVRFVMLDVDGRLSEAVKWKAPTFMFRGNSRRSTRGRRSMSR